MAKKYIKPQIVAAEMKTGMLLKSIEYSTEDYVNYYGITGVGYANFEETATSKKRNNVVDMGKDDDEW